MNIVDVMGEMELVSPVGLPDTHLSAALGQNIKSPNRLIASKDSYATLAVGLPELVSFTRLNIILNIK